MAARASRPWLSRTLTGAMLVGIGCALAGCGGAVNSFDPTDMLSFLDQKKPLPGERKPVFPEGVPGVEQGVPKELYKGAQQDDLAANPAAVAPEAGAGTDVSAGASTANAAPAAEEHHAAPPPKKKPARTARRRSVTAPPPDSEPAAAPPPPPPQQAAPLQQQQLSPFPAPLPSGSFQH